MQLKNFWKLDPLHIIVLPLLVLSMLWKGGKSLEMTWLLTLGSFITIFWSYWKDKKGLTKLSSIHLVLWSVSILLVVWSVVAYIFSETQNYGLDEVLRTTSVIGLFLWIVHRSNAAQQRASTVHTLLRTLSIVMMLACLLGIAVYILQPVNRFVGTFFDHRFHTDYWPNAWAQLVLLTWPLMLLWATIITDPKKQYMRMAGIGLLLGCLLLSFSRGSWIAFIGQCGLGALFLMRIRTGRIVDIAGEWAVRVGIIIMCAVVTFVAINQIRAPFHPIQSIEDKVTFNASEGKTSVNERYQFWWQSIALAGQKPFTGWGPYSFRFVQPRLQKDVLATSDHPHNMFLKQLMEQGIIGFILLCALLLLIVVPAARMLWSLSSSLSVKEKQVLLIMLMAALGVVAHNLIDYNLQFVGILLPFWLILGLIVSYTLRTKNKNTQTWLPILQRSGEVGFISLALMIAVIETPPMILSSFGRHAEAAGKIEEALQWYSAADHQLLSRDLHLSKALLLWKENDIKGALRTIDKTLQLNPHDARTWKIKGQILQTINQRELALGAYETAAQYGQWNDISIVLNQIQLQIQRKAQEELEQDRERIDTLIIAYADAIADNIHFIAFGANADMFLEIAATASRVFPDREPVYQVLAARVDRSMKAFRADWNTRRPGYLW